MVDVLIVDDHPVMRELLRQVLEPHGDVFVVGEAVNGEDALRQVVLLRPAVALIDIHLPTMSGIEAAKLIRRQSPGTAVIGLTAGEPDHHDMAMITAGASSVINKADVLLTLYPAILEAANVPKGAVSAPSSLKSTTK